MPQSDKAIFNLKDIVDHLTNQSGLDKEGGA